MKKKHKLSSTGAQPLLKFIYSEKATKFCEISTLDLTDTTLDKSTVEISQKFVAFSEYMNFIYLQHRYYVIFVYTTITIDDDQ